MNFLIGVVVRCIAITIAAVGAAQCVFESRCLAASEVMVSNLEVSGIQVLMSSSFEEKDWCSPLRGTGVTYLGTMPMWY